MPLDHIMKIERSTFDFQGLLREDILHSHSSGNAGGGGPVNAVSHLAQADPGDPGGGAQAVFQPGLDGDEVAR